jgi:hypothetical protein
MKFFFGRLITGRITPWANRKAVCPFTAFDSGIPAYGTFWVEIVFSPTMRAVSGKIGNFSVAVGADKPGHNSIKHQLNFRGLLWPLRSK